MEAYKLTLLKTMPTRTQAAEFIVANLEVSINGESLLSRREMHLGPTRHGDRCSV